MYLEKYNEFMKFKHMGVNSGLCSVCRFENPYAYRKHNELMDLMKPTSKKEYNPKLTVRHRVGSYDELLDLCFWAADGETDGRGQEYQFTPLRQTIMLFLAALNNEL